MVPVTLVGGGGHRHPKDRHPPAGPCSQGRAPPVTELCTPRPCPRPPSPVPALLKLSRRTRLPPPRPEVWASGGSTAPTCRDERPWAWERAPPVKEGPMQEPKSSSEADFKETRETEETFPSCFQESEAGQGHEEGPSAPRGCRPHTKRQAAWTQRGRDGGVSRKRPDTRPRSPRTARGRGRKGEARGSQTDASALSAGGPGLSGGGPQEGVSSCGRRQPKPRPVCTSKRHLSRQAPPRRDH